MPYWLMYRGIECDVFSSLFGRDLQDRVIKAPGELGDSRTLEPLLALFVQVTDFVEVSRQKQLIGVLSLLGDAQTLELLRANQPQAN